MSSSFTEEKRRSSRSRSPRRSRSRSRSRGRSRSKSRSRSRGRSRSRSRSRGRRSRSRGGNGKEKGVASRWNERGFCFITPSNGDEDIFCHVSAIQDGNCIEEGATVHYEKSYDDRKGKYRAENVTGGFTSDRDRDGGYGRGGFGGGGYRGGGSDECYDWRDGRCTRGNSCKFSHEGRGGGGGGRDDRRSDRYDRDDRYGRDDRDRRRY